VAVLGKCRKMLSRSSEPGAGASPVRLGPFYACRAVVFAKAGRSTRLAPFMLSVFYEFPPKSDSQFLRQCDGKIFQTRNS
jgi:hypothetical protein